MNVGLVGFVIGLILQAPALKRGFSPVMGLGILAHWWWCGAGSARPSRNG
jgi:hypothetical protein